MSQIVQAGTFATAYGVSVPVFRDAARQEDGDDGFVLPAEAAAILAGIYDPELRRGYVRAAAERGGNVPVALFDEFGGHKPPRMQIPIPDRFVYQSSSSRLGFGDTTCDGMSIRDVLDFVITEATDRHRWCDRAHFLLQYLEGQLAQATSLAPGIQGDALSMMLSAVLENFGEQEIDCLEQAAFYSLCIHSEWRRVGQRWLLPFRKTWLADWIAARPAYRRLAKTINRGHIEVPSWLMQVTR